LLRTGREVNDEMIEYWAGKLVQECMKLDKPLKDVKICIKGMTFRKGVKELYHSRNVALAQLLVEKGLDIYAYDELLTNKELEALGLRRLEPRVSRNEHVKTTIKGADHAHGHDVQAERGGYERIAGKGYQKTPLREESRRICEGALLYKEKNVNRTHQG
jgi:UDP-N-acetyl-D-mannosaminuronate dehydrogenase